MKPEMATPAPGNEPQSGSATRSVASTMPLEYLGYASMFRRIGAFLIDGVLCVIPGMAGPDLFMVVDLVYFTLCESWLGGATVGKWLLGIKVVNAQYKRISLPRALLRTFVKLCCWPAAAVTVLLDEKSRGLHDLAAGSVVLRKRFLRFGPRWLHPRPSVRLKAVQKVEDRAVLLTVAMEDPDAEVAFAAIAKLPNSDLAEIAINSPRNERRLAAVKRIEDEKVMADVICAPSHHSPDVWQSALKRIKTWSIVDRILSEAPSEVRAFVAKRFSEEQAAALAKKTQRPAAALACIERVSDETLLIEIFMQWWYRRTANVLSSGREVCMAVLLRVRNQPFLTSVATGQFDVELRVEAAERLEDVAVLRQLAENQSNLFVLRRCAALRIGDMDLLTAILEEDAQMEARQAARQHAEGTRQTAERSRAEARCNQSGEIRTVYRSRSGAPAAIWVGRDRRGVPHLEDQEQLRVIVTATRIHSWVRVRLGGLELRTVSTMMPPPFASPELPSRPLIPFRDGEMTFPMGNESFCRQVHIIADEENDRIREVDQKFLRPGLWFSALLGEGTPVGYESRIYVIPENELGSFAAKVKQQGPGAFQGYDSFEDPTLPHIREQGGMLLIKP